MASLPAERRAENPGDLHASLEAYYARYYRDTLGIPGWRDYVAVRLADHAYEGARLVRLQRALGRPVHGLRLLNVGCGTGGFNVVAEQAGALTCGADADPEAVAIAKARVPGRPILRALAEALPFSDGSFDIVYCYSTLEHVRDSRQAVYEMVRVLRSGAALYLHTPNRWACFEGHYKLFWVPGLPGWAARAYLSARRRPTAFLEKIRPLSLGECRSFLEQAGARIARVFDDDANRPVGGPLWSLVRLYYRLFRIHPYVELLAIRKGDS